MSSERDKATKESLAQIQGAVSSLRASQEELEQEIARQRGKLNYG